MTDHDQVDTDYIPVIKSGQGRDDDDISIGVFLWAFIMGSVFISACLIYALWKHS